VLKDQDFLGFSFSIFRFRFREILDFRPTAERNNESYSN
jgi:hypothetical protein